MGTVLNKMNGHKLTFFFLFLFFWKTNIHIPQARVNKILTDMVWLTTTMATLGIYTCRSNLVQPYIIFFLTQNLNPYAENGKKQREQGEHDLFTCLQQVCTSYRWDPLLVQSSLWNPTQYCSLLLSHTRIRRCLIYVLNIQG